jgi:twinkle protein
MAKIFQMPPRYEQPGYHALADLPQASSIASIARSTGWAELDEIFKIYPGQFVVVTGTAGHGKSTFLLNVVCNLADQGVKSFLYVPENERHLRDKLALIWGDRQNWEVFENTQCFVQSALPQRYDEEPHTLDWVLNRALTAVVEDGVKLILLDPWNEIERAKPRDMLLTDYIGQCLSWIKGFCRTHEVTVILVAHPTKAGISDGKIPSLADIEGSLNWYNKADNGLIVVREPNKPVTRVISAKVREHGAGKRGVCYFNVDEKTGIFTPQYGAVSVGGNGQ